MTKIDIWGPEQIIYALDRQKNTIKENMQMSKNLLMRCLHALGWSTEARTMKKLESICNRVRILQNLPQNSPISIQANTGSEYTQVLAQKLEELRKNPENKQVLQAYREIAKIHLQILLQDPNKARQVDVLQRALNFSFIEKLFGNTRTVIPKEQYKQEYIQKIQALSRSIKNAINKLDNKGEIELYQMELSMITELDFQTLQLTLLWKKLASELKIRKLQQEFNEMNNRIDKLN